MMAAAAAVVVVVVVRETMCHFLSSRRCATCPSRMRVCVSVDQHSLFHLQTRNRMITCMPLHSAQSIHPSINSSSPSYSSYRNAEQLSTQNSPIESHTVSGGGICANHPSCLIERSRVALAKTLPRGLQGYPCMYSCAPRTTGACVSFPAMLTIVDHPQHWQTRTNPIQNSNCNSNRDLFPIHLVISK